MLEQLFENYLKKQEAYDAVIEEYVSARLDPDGNATRGPKIAMTKAHRKFTKEFRSIHGDDINKLIEWQNARI